MNKHRGHQLLLRRTTGSAGVEGRHLPSHICHHPPHEHNAAPATPCAPANPPRYPNSLCGFAHVFPFSLPNAASSHLSLDNSHQNLETLLQSYLDLFLTLTLHSRSTLSLSLPLLTHSQRLLIFHAFASSSEVPASRSLRSSLPVLLHTVSCMEN